MLDEIILEIIKYSGLSGAIIALLVGGLWSIYFNRIKEAQKTEFQKQIENLKSKNEKLNYITKTQFDAEFKMYQELSEASFLMFYDVSFLFPDQMESAYLDEQKENERLKNLYNTAHKSLKEYQNILFKYAPFISKDLYESFEKLFKDGLLQVNFFPDYRLNKSEHISFELKQACLSRTTQMAEKKEELVKELREYLSSLKVQKD